MQTPSEGRKASLTSAIAVILALAIAAGALFYSFTGTRNITTTSIQVLTNTINNTVTSVSTTTATSVSTAYSTITSTSTSVLTSTSTATNILTSTSTATSVLTSTSTETVTTTSQPTFSTVFVLYNNTVSINGSSYNSLCKCNTPGVWVWTSSTQLSHLGYLKISVLPNITYIDLLYTVNGTIYSTAWCFSKSLPNCSNGPPQVTVAVLPGTIIDEILLINDSPNPVTVNVEVSYHY